MDVAIETRATAWALLVVAACTCRPATAPRTAEAAWPEYPHGVRFAGFSETCVDIPAHMAWNDLAHNAGRRLTDLEREGACTWYFWPGGDPLATGGDPADARGNPRFWRRAEVRTAEIAEATGLRVGLNLVDFVDSRRRAERFAELGLVNDPNCTAADEPDAYGLWLDRCRDPYSSGILGIRLFPNPAFEAASWDPERFLDPRRTAADAAIEPPYLAGLTCAVCHVAFNPVNPPRDPERPGWENLAPAFGNQFLREGEMFKAGLSEEDFLYHVFDGQQPGTSDTSRISVDWINNPNAINPIFFIASVRPAWEEEMADGTVRRVPRVLKDGADSVGLAQAALRVYVNIGTCGDYRSTLEDAFTGLEPQRPFDVKHAAAECADWRLTAGRMKGAAAFLDAVRPYRLADAPGGERHLTADAETLALGKRAFAAHCTRCHSSKLPPGLTHEGDAKHLPAAVPAWTELVLRPDFLDDNFLSDDRRYPLVSDNPYRAIGTNAARALATNARAGHLWQGFSSATYKALPSPGMLTLNDPFGGGEIAFEVPAGGNGWYRTPSLVNLWATAPFLHNNALGLYNHDPSVDGRIAAYEDAAEKLLWPERRLGERSIKRTPRDTVLRFRTLDVRVPAGTPVNLLANLDLRRAAADEARLARLEALLEGPSHLGRLAGGGELARELLALNQAPDFVEDHGHTHHGSLTDGEKRALIEYMKTF